LSSSARGSIIDQDALLSALRDGELAGAALDVYDKEPLPADHELLELDNVVTTPHIGGAATGVIERHSEMVTNDIAALLDGRDPTHVANDVAPQASHKAGGD
jgi:D-3-phosphoglycerate dehydrogenase